ncbi:MAG: tetratricopeptide repeat protein [Paludibacteraceae bacterium]|nr:tetratricopeptide repeat protein [Paludibacteraceae bacterium]
MALAIACSSCSTEKNTAATRSFHQTKVKYNIFFNGNIAFEEGQRAIINAHEDDFSTIIPLYPVSDHKAAEASKSQMDKTIEKCRKCIKLHSIKAKPKPDPKKRKDPKYKLWLEQEEFNNQMGNVWVRLGEAEFSKGDFLGSVGTFSYVMRHYQTDPDVYARCQLWIARAYAEMGWQYEAEDMINKVEVDALSRRHASLYAAAKADVLLKGKQYHEAIPFVKLAIPDEKRKVHRPRFQYVLAQLYQAEGKNKEAIDSYKRCIKMAPVPAMDFNARINLAILQGRSSVKALLKMAKLSKNKNQLDLIYGAIGNIYLAAGDTAKALENYQLAIEKSTNPGPAKAAVLIQAGDLYYDRRDYVPAQPCYQEAVTIIDAQNEDYDRLQKRSAVLDELIVAYSTVQLQDSLQRLAKMTPEEQRAVVDKIIEDLIKAEEEAAEKELIAQREAENEGLQSVDTRNMLGGGGGAAADWYFYNPQLMRSGKQAFIKQWGNRQLEDNWRRKSKTVVANFDTPTEEEMTDVPDSLANDSVPAVAPVETDTHKPEYYLQQIPKTEADIALSDSLIADALYDLIYIYQDKVGDQALADETFAEFERRFPNDRRLVDLYYMKYLQALKNNNAADEAKYRNIIVSRWPDSDQARIVSQPDYFERLQHMAQEQDSVYEATYNAYRKSEFATVKANKRYAEENYPFSPLMPRFLFLNAVATARTDGQEAFIVELKDMVARYPESELGAMAKDMLAMMGQGMESQKGAMTSDLDELRQQATGEAEEAAAEKQFSAETNTASLILLCLPDANEPNLNKLLYEVALFNFSQFLIRDFDLQKMPVWEEGCALRISGFENLGETEWYIGLTQKNTDLQAVLRELQVRELRITEDNYKLIPGTFSVEEYEKFLLELQKNASKSPQTKKKR